MSLLGFNYKIVVGGFNVAESGTSASAPAFAAMVSLVNAARLRAGKGPLGFLNIILYQSYSIWANDITVGDNSCSGTNEVTFPNCCSGLGFVAANGWDPVTGLGSVDFNAFSAYLTSLPASGKCTNHGHVRSSLIAIVNVVASETSITNYPTLNAQTSSGSLRTHIPLYPSYKSSECSVQW